SLKNSRTLFIVCGVSTGPILLAASWVAGSILSSPVNRSCGELPNHLTGSRVEFPSESGSTIRGWLIPGRKGAGAIALMHGYRGDRVQLLGRASFLLEAGYSLLLFDFQAHGESGGKRITLGYLESRDARAAVEFLRQHCPGEKIGVIGLSMGGAA